MLKCQGIHRESGNRIIGEAADRIAAIIGFYSTCSYQAWMRMQKTQELTEAEDLAFESPADARCILSHCLERFKRTEEEWYEDTARRISMLLGDASLEDEDWGYREGEYGPGND